MSTLTEALDRIFIRLQQKGFLTTSLLPPGLTPAEIEAIVKDLPIHLPQEVYEIYQWSKGFDMDRVYETLSTPPGQGAYFFNAYALISLQDVVKIYQEKLKSLKYYYENDVELYSPNWIQIFVCYSSELQGYIVISDNTQNCEIIFTYCKDNERKRQYVSLTSMMQTLAEWYECTNLGSDNPTEKFDEIWRKYNSSLVDAVLEKLTDKLSYESLLEIAQDLMKFKDSRSVEPLIRILQKQTSFDDFRRQELAARILGELGDTRAVEPLIDALQNEYWLTRHWSAVSLGNLKDKRAVKSLTQALRDEHKEVRNMARRALDKLDP